MGVTIQPPENVYRKPYEFVSSSAYLVGALSLVFLLSLSILFQVLLFISSHTIRARFVAPFFVQAILLCFIRLVISI